MGLLHRPDPFERAYRTEGAYVAAVLSRLAVPADTLGDAVQDVFAAAYRRWGDFDETRPVRPWLTEFARRVAFRYRRSAARRARKDLALSLLEPTIEPTPIHGYVARDFLREFLAAEDPGHREAFVMAEIAGFTAGEIAQMLQISPAAVYGRVRATRQRLRQALLADAKTPSKAAVAAVPPWAMFAPRIGLSAAHPWWIPGFGVVGANKVGLAATVVVAGLGAAGLSAVDRPTAVEGREAMAAAAADDAKGGVESAQPPVAAARSLGEPVTVGVEDRTLQRREDARAAQGSAASRGPRAPTAAARDTPEAPGALAAEVALIQAAEEKLMAAAPKAALTYLVEHERGYRHGQLADARRRLRIRALCDLGREAQARQEADAMARAQPGAPLALQATAICSRAIDPKKPSAGQ